MNTFFIAAADAYNAGLVSNTKCGSILSSYRRKRKVMLLSSNFRELYFRLKEFSHHHLIGGAELSKIAIGIAP